MLLAEAVAFTSEADGRTLTNDCSSYHELLDDMVEVVYKNYSPVAQLNLFLLLLLCYSTKK